MWLLLTQDYYLVQLNYLWAGLWHLNKYTHSVCLTYLQQNILLHKIISTRKVVVVIVTRADMVAVVFVCLSKYSSMLMFAVIPHLKNVCLDHYITCWLHRKCSAGLQLAAGQQLLWLQLNSLSSYRVAPMAENSILSQCFRYPHLVAHGL